MASRRWLLWSVRGSVFMRGSPGGPPVGGEGTGAAERISSDGLTLRVTTAVARRDWGRSVAERKPREADDEEEKEARTFMISSRGELGTRVLGDEEDAGDAQTIADDGQRERAREDGELFFPDAILGEVGVNRAGSRRGRHQ